MTLKAAAGFYLIKDDDEVDGLIHGLVVSAGEQQEDGKPPEAQEDDCIWAHRLQHEIRIGNCVLVPFGAVVAIDTDIDQEDEEEEPGLSAGQFRAMVWDLCMDLVSRFLAPPAEGPSPLDLLTNMEVAADYIVTLIPSEKIRAMLEEEDFIKGATDKLMELFEILRAKVAPITPEAAEPAAAEPPEPAAPAPPAP